VRVAAASGLYLSHSRRKNPYDLFAIFRQTFSSACRSKCAPCGEEERLLRADSVLTTSQRCTAIEQSTRAFGCLAYHRKMPIDMKTLAEAGARSRLTELEQEIEELKRAFPSIGRGTRKATASSNDAPAQPGAKATRRRTRKPMTAAQKKAVGERMKAYWAARRKDVAKADRKR
jgi:hypothetical protein